MLICFANETESHDEQTNDVTASLRAAATGKWIVATVFDDHGSRVESWSWLSDAQVWTTIRVGSISSSRPPVDTSPETRARNVARTAALLGAFGHTYQNPPAWQRRS